MVGSPVETYWTGESWRNRVGEADPLPGEYQTREAAAEVARGDARVRGVEHVIRSMDGSVSERCRYPRSSAELPG